MCVRIADIPHLNQKYIIFTWKITILTVLLSTSFMTRGILSSQMQTLPACYFKLIPKPSDWAYFFYFSASNITFLALLQVQLKNLLPLFYTTFGILMNNFCNQPLLKIMKMDDDRVNVVCNVFNIFIKVLRWKILTTVYHIFKVNLLQVLFFPKPAYEILTIVTTNIRVTSCTLFWYSIFYSILPLYTCTTYPNLQ